MTRTVLAGLVCAAIVLASAAGRAEIVASCPARPEATLSIVLGAYRGPVVLTTADTAAPLTPSMRCTRTESCVCGVAGLPDGAYALRLSGAPGGDGGHDRPPHLTLAQGRVAMDASAVAAVDPADPARIVLATPSRTKIDFRGYDNPWALEGWQRSAAVDGGVQTLELLPDTVYGLVAGSALAERFSIDRAGGLHHEDNLRQSFVIDPADPTRARLRTTVVELSPLDADGRADPEAGWGVEFGARYKGPARLVLADNGAYLILDDRTPGAAGQWLAVSNACQLASGGEQAAAVAWSGFEARVVSGPCDPTQ